MAILFLFFCVVSLTLSKIKVSECIGYREFVALGPASLIRGTAFMKSWDRLANYSWSAKRRRWAESTMATMVNKWALSGAHLLYLLPASSPEKLRRMVILLRTWYKKRNERMNLLTNTVQWVGLDLETPYRSAMSRTRSVKSSVVGWANKRSGSVLERWCDRYWTGVQGENCPTLAEQQTLAAEPPIRSDHRVSATQLLAAIRLWMVNKQWLHALTTWQRANVKRSFFIRRALR